MTTKFKQAIETITGLSQDEKALIAHCLISSLERAPEDGVETAWVALAEDRYAELQSGSVKVSTWQEIKSTVKG
jgi:hypothetical protein